MEYDKDLVKKKKELAKTLAELGGDLDSDDFDDLEQDELLENVLIEAKYKYLSHSSDEDKKYMDKKNRNFVFWKS